MRPQVRARQPGASDVALICSFLHHDGIRIFRAEAGSIPVSRFLLSVLVREGLMWEGEPGAMNMHPTVQEVLRNSLRQTPRAGGPTRPGQWRIPFLWRRRAADVPARKEERFASPYLEYRSLAEEMVKLEMLGSQARLLPQAAPHLLRLVEHGCQDLDVLAAAARFLADVQNDTRRALELQNTVLRAQLRRLREGSGGEADARLQEEAVETFMRIAELLERRRKFDSATQVREEVARRGGGHPCGSGESSMALPPIRAR